MFFHPRLFLALALVAISCASEDPDLVNPPPSRTGIALRFLNLVPDGRPRSLLLDDGFQSQPQVYAQVAATIQAPTDSSFLEVSQAGTTEFRSFRRQTFSRNTIANIIAMAPANGSLAADTAIVRSVVVPFGRSAVGSLRLMNAYRDSSVQFILRRGCPSGPNLTPSPVPYKGASLYADLPPGPSVVSVIERDAFGGERTIGLYEATVAAGSASMIVVFTDIASGQPRLMMVNETDTSAGAEIPLPRVAERTGEMRVVNTTAFPATVRLASGQVVASQVASRRVSTVATVGACLQVEADKYIVTLDGGPSVTDSTSFGVRQRMTMVVYGDASDVRSVVIPQSAPVNPASGQARLRVVHAAPSIGAVNVSIGGRSDASASNGISAGAPIASGLEPGAAAPALLVNAGELPFTVSTARTPTTVLHVSRTEIQAGGDYILIVDGDPSGLTTFLLSIDEADRQLQATPQGVFLRFVNATNRQPSLPVTIGRAVSSGTVFYRNSVSTSVDPGSVNIQAGTANRSVTARIDDRTLVVATERDGQVRLEEFVTLPLPTVLGRTARRAVNLTSDVQFVSVAFDSVPAQTPDAAHLYRDLEYGRMSGLDVTTTARRGSMYFYDTSTFAELFRLPIDVVPLGSSVTYIICGNRELGYDVVALQEF